MFATVIARLTTSLWYEPWVLLSRHLAGGVGSYFARQAAAILLWSACYAVVYGVVRAVGVEGVRHLVMATALSAVVMPLAIVVAYRRTTAFAALTSRARLVRSSAVRSRGSHG